MVVSNPHYSCVLVKISGEMLGANGQSADHGPLLAERLQLIARELKAVRELGVRLAVVIGGGNIVRGAQMAEDHELTRVNADSMGMLATVINGLALMDFLEKIGVPTRVMSAIPMDRLAEPYILRRATRHLDKGRVVIFVAGTGNPYFSTDTAAALRANEIGAQLLIKATKVDGVYSADPAHNPGAQKFETISFAECMQKDLKVMDATAFALCRENKLPVLVCNLLEENALAKAVKGEKIGTLVC